MAALREHSPAAGYEQGPSTTRHQEPIAVPCQVTVKTWLTRSKLLCRHSHKTMILDVRDASMNFEFCWSLIILGATPSARIQTREWSGCHICLWGYTPIDIAEVSRPTLVLLPPSVTHTHRLLWLSSSPPPWLLSIYLAPTIFQLNLTQFYSFVKKC